MTKFADLHIHTFYSDSTDSPQMVVEGAVQAGLSCIAITDHDTLEGIKPTMAAAEEFDIEVIPGVELSTELDGKDIHMLAYLFDLDSDVLAERLNCAQDSRVKRVEEMIEKLRKLGIDNIVPEEVCSLTESKSVGRPHLAAMLVTKGWVSNIKQAFDKYLAEDKPAYVPKYKISPFEAIELVREAGGVTVMAHPMVTRKDEIIPRLVEAGMNGIEVYYPNHPQATQIFYEGIARKHNLIMTGGSDAHGKAKSNTFIGKAKIPYEQVEKLKACKEQLA